MADVLIVDDRPDIRYALARVLESAGHTVTEAPARDARSLLDRPVELVICDIQHPLGDGQRLIRDAARRQPDAKLVAVVADGLASSPASLARARSHGVDAVLRVPIEFDPLLGTVERLLGEKPVGRQQLFA